MSDQQNELLLAVGRLEGKMDAMQSDFRESKREVNAQLSALEERVRVSENRWAWVLGAAAVISFAAPYITAYLHK